MCIFKGLDWCEIQPWIAWWQIYLRKSWLFSVYLAISKYHWARNIFIVKRAIGRGIRIISMRFRKNTLEDQPVKQFFGRFLIFLTIILLIALTWLYKYLNSDLYCYVPNKFDKNKVLTIKNHNTINSEIIFWIITVFLCYI